MRRPMPVLSSVEPLRVLLRKKMRILFAVGVPLWKLFRMHF